MVDDAVSLPRKPRNAIAVIRRCKACKMLRSIEDINPEIRSVRAQDSGEILTITGSETAILLGPNNEPPDASFTMTRPQLRLLLSSSFTNFRAYLQLLIQSVSKHLPEHLKSTISRTIMSDQEVDACDWRPVPVRKDQELLENKALRMCNRITTAKSVHLLHTSCHLLT